MHRKFFKPLIVNKFNLPSRCSKLVDEEFASQEKWTVINKVWKLVVTRATSGNEVLKQHKLQSFFMKVSVEEWWIWKSVKGRKLRNGIWQGRGRVCSKSNDSFEIWSKFWHAIYFAEKSLSVLAVSFIAQCNWSLFVIPLQHRNHKTLVKNCSVFRKRFLLFINGNSVAMAMERANKHLLFLKADIDWHIGNNEELISEYLGLKTKE